MIEVIGPPLRERREDIALLVDYMLDRQAKRLHRPRPSITPEALSALSGVPWPGKVRELENAVERAILLAEADTLAPSDFGLSTGGPVPVAEGASLKDAARAAAADTERRMIQAALDDTGGNVTQAAERLGLSRRGLQIKMKELGLR